MPVRWPSIERNLFILRRRPSVRSNCIQEFHFTIEYGRPLAQWFGKARGQQAHSRRASTTPSVTAVNAKRAIPEQFQALYASLKALERDAGVFVNSSQLQLALRGVESEDAVTRVAGEQTGNLSLCGTQFDEESSLSTQWQVWSTQADESPTRGSFGWGATMGEADPVQ